MTVTGLAQRLAVSLRLSWPAILVGLAGGATAQVLLPIRDAWLAGAAAAACAVLALLLLPLGPDVDGSLPPRTQVERWSTAGQFGHAFLAAALGLAGFWLGATVTPT